MMMRHIDPADISLMIDLGGGWEMLSLARLFFSLLGLDVPKGSRNSLLPSVLWALPGHTHSLWKSPPWQSFACGWWGSLASPVSLLLSYLAYTQPASVINKSGILATIFTCLFCSPNCLEPRLFFFGHATELILMMNRDWSEITA